MRKLIAGLTVGLALGLVVTAGAQDTTSLLSTFLVGLRNQILGDTTLNLTYRAADGTAAAPSLAFATETNKGVYSPSSLAVGFSVNSALRAAVDSSGSANQFTLANGSQLAFSSGSAIGNSADLALSRVSAGVAKLAHGTATSTAELQVSGGSGGFLSAVKALTELTTIAAAATTTTAIQLPANAVILAVSVRVVTVIPTAATFTVTSATPAKTWNTAAVAVASGTTDTGTAPGPTFQTTASVITFTPNLTPATGTGQVRVTVYYYQVTPATS